MKDIPGYEGLYACTEDGQVWSHPKMRGLIRLRGRFMKPYKEKKGYLSIRISDRKYQVHRLVGLTFIENNNNLPHINHKNGIKHDNRAENLEWCTAQENVRHSWNELGRKFTKNMYENLKDMSKKNQKKVMQLTREGILCKTYGSITECAKVLGVSLSTLSVGISSKRKINGYSFITCNK